ncbi:MAG: fasciclin domain-containing protein, partial [Mycobacterium sp.]|nr:fasciclin domain-containing protein [Mycobacterium sp.]
VNLVDTLNGGEFTVFAPTDEAFAKIDAATIEKLKTDSGLPTSILSYHGVRGQATPAQVGG